MTKVILRGILGKKFGENWILDVQSITEIFDAIESNTQKVSKYFRHIEKFATHFLIFVDGKMLPPHLVNSKILKNNNVEIVPIVQGGAIDPFTAALIIGLILTVVSIVLAIVLSPKSPRDVKTSSTILGSIRNVLNRNIAIPIGYGRLRIGSAVISNDIIVQPFKSSEVPNQFLPIN